MTTDRPSIDRPSYEEASRFLTQAGFGGNEADVEHVRALGLEGWFREQLTLPYVDNTSRYQAVEGNTGHVMTAILWEGIVHGDDQLRRRVAYALGQILVVSYRDLGGNEVVFTRYADWLAEEAFTSYAAVLRRVSYSPAMGYYLNHLGNRKADPQRGTVPNENYARELMQLFTIGPSPLDAAGRPLPGRTYGPDDVAGLAAIFTGLSWAGKDRFRGGKVRRDDPAATLPMDAYPVAHEARTKRFLGYEAKGDDPIKAIDGALAHLIAHENTPVFIGRLLIQKLVTSNPTPAYVARVAEAFRTGEHVMPSGARVGTGVRSDLTATIAAILFDEEARSPARLTDPRFGRVRQPTLRYAHLVRAFRRPHDVAGVPVPLGRMSHARFPTFFGEHPWHPPSVFGSFRPGYAPPNSLTEAAGMVAPEMTVLNEGTAGGYVRFVWDTLRRKDDDALTLDTAPLEAVVGSSSELAKVIARRLLHDAPSPRTADRLKAALARLGKDGDVSDTDEERRLLLALFMGATDPGFAVQR